MVYLKEESVDLAVRLFDETELRYAANGADKIKVQKAEFKPKEARTPADGNGSATDAKKKKRQKKADRLRSKLADWDSDEEAAAPSLRHGGKVVVLKHMFSKAELDEDPALLLDLKEDVREEAETLGEVTNVTLYDVCPRSSAWLRSRAHIATQLEDDGVMTIRFKDPISAQACIKVRPRPL